jgi:hypothetical protein
LARSIRAKSVYSRTSVVVAAVADRGCRSHPPSLTSLRARLRRVEKLRRTSRVQLSRKFGTFQQNRPGALHFVECAIDVPRLELDSTAAIQDNVSIQAEVTSIEHALFDAVIQSQTHKVDVLDGALL